jgi:catechol 2,3-dioxygenase-like lactoylglutathione lyase family enzyme
LAIEIIKESREYGQARFGGAVEESPDGLTDVGDKTPTNIEETPPARRAPRDDDQDEEDELDELDPEAMEEVARKYDPPVDAVQKANAAPVPRRAKPHLAHWVASTVDPNSNSGVAAKAKARAQGSIIREGGPEQHPATPAAPSAWRVEDKQPEVEREEPRRGTLGPRKVHHLQGTYRRPPVNGGLKPKAVTTARSAK